MLGRITERVTKMSYEQYVRENVLAPMGISQPATERGEIQESGHAISVFPDVASPVPWPYGGWCMESMDSHGGWVASAIDYSKFVNPIDGRWGSAFRRHRVLLN